MYSMKPINFVIRDGSGRVQDGQVPADKAVHELSVHAGQRLSINLQPGDVSQITRDGSHLYILLRDGRGVRINRFFELESTRGCLLFSARGAGFDVNFADPASAFLSTHFSAVDLSQNRSWQDDMVFEGHADIVRVGACPVPNIAPLIEVQGPEDKLVISGETEPGSTVQVMLDGCVVAADVDEAGLWQAGFERDRIARGTYPAEMRAVATDPMGQSNTAVQPVVVDHADNRVAIFVAPEMTCHDGIELGGQVEPGMTIHAEFQGQMFNGIVDDEGNWTLRIPSEQIATGIYEAEITVTATTATGEAETLTERLSVDTGSPHGAVFAVHA